LLLPLAERAGWLLFCIYPISEAYGTGVLANAANPTLRPLIGLAAAGRTTVQ
jgi:hypothetical protein